MIQKTKRVLKRSLLLILLYLLLASSAAGQSFVDLVFPGQQRDFPQKIFPVNDYEYGYARFGYLYQDILSISGADDSNKANHYISNKSYFLQAQADVEPFSFYTRYKQPSFSMYTNNLSDISDEFHFTHDTAEFDFTASFKYKILTFSGGFFYSNGPGGSMKIEAEVFNGHLGAAGSYKPSWNTFSYSVREIGGAIPLNYYRGECSLFYYDKSKHFEARYALYNPLNEDGKFTTEISGFDTGGRVWFKLAPFDFTLEGEYTKISADCMYEESPYGKLDSFFYYHYHGRGSFNFWEESSISLGVTGLKTGVGEDSYFDLWPFSYWDMFMASKTRLSNLDIKLIMPYFAFDLSRTWKFGSLHIKPGFLTSYYHLFTGCTVTYEEKVWEVYPFVSRYEPHTKKFDPGYDGIIKLELKFSARYKAVEFSLLAAQLIPVNFS
ncbi:MAG: hypothetical protein GY754_25160, partial [bacterium]|nr:hypothetical protein [bacterium]